MKQLKELKSKGKSVKRGGELVAAIILLISAIIALIMKIIDFVSKEKDRQQQEAERKRREDEAKKAKEEVKLADLLDMLKEYDEELGEMAASYNMTVLDLILSQLKDATSRVNTMKRGILSKAKDFPDMTLPEFMNLCIDKASKYSWYNV